MQDKPACANITDKEVYEFVGEIAERRSAGSAGSMSMEAFTTPMKPKPDSEDCFLSVHCLGMPRSFPYT